MHGMWCGMGNNAHGNQRAYQGLPQGSHGQSPTAHQHTDDGQGIQARGGRLGEGRIYETLKLLSDLEHLHRVEATQSSYNGDGNYIHLSRIADDIHRRYSNLYIWSMTNAHRHK